MIKKIFTISLLTLILGISMLYPLVSHAQLEPFRETPLVDGSTEALETAKIYQIDYLPSQSWPQLIATIITFLLAITGSLAFASFTVGGVLMVTARGNDEQITKGKDIIFWSILALLIIAVSYGVVIGLTELQLIQ